MSSNLRGIVKRHLWLRVLWCYHAAFWSHGGIDSISWGSRMSLRPCLEFFGFGFIISCRHLALLCSSEDCHSVVRGSSFQILFSIMMVFLICLERAVATAALDVGGQAASVAFGLPEFISHIGSSIFIFFYLHFAILTKLRAFR